MSEIRVGLSPKLQAVIPGFVPATVTYTPMEMSIFLIDETIPGREVTEADLKPRFVADPLQAVESLIRVVEVYSDVENALSLSELRELRDRFQKEAR